MTMMRLSKTIKINNSLCCTVYELAVWQWLFLLWLYGDHEYPTHNEAFIAENMSNLLSRAWEVIEFDKPGMSLKKLKASEKEAVLTLFMQVNTAFFNGGDADGLQSSMQFPPTQTGSEIYQAISDNVAALIGNGHAQALDYPFSFYLSVVDILSRQSNG